MSTVNLSRAGARDRAAARPYEPTLNWDSRRLDSVLGSEDKSLPSDDTRLFGRKRLQLRLRAADALAETPALDYGAWPSVSWLGLFERAACSGTVDEISNKVKYPA